MKITRRAEAAHKQPRTARGMPFSPRASRLAPLIHKELLQTSRDKLTLFFTLVLPVIFTVFLGLLLGGTGNTEAALPLAITDADGSKASQELLTLLADEPSLALKPMKAEAVDKAVLNQEVAAGLIIPSSYGEALEQGQPVSLKLVRLETSTGAQSINEVVRSIVARVNIRLLAARIAAKQVATATGDFDDAILTQRALLIAEAELASPTISLTRETSAAASEAKVSGFTQASPGSIVNWVLFGLLTVTTGLAWERRQGLLRRLRAAGTTRADIFGGKFAAAFIITFLQQLFLVLLGQLAFGVSYFSSPAALFLVMISLSAFAASLGLLVAAVLRSEQAIVAAIVILAQLLAALGGAWFPLDITSGAFAHVAHFLPLAWIMDSFQGIIFNSWGIGEVLSSVGIPWLWTAALLGIGMWRFRPE